MLPYCRLPGLAAYSVGSLGLLDLLDLPSQSLSLKFLSLLLPRGWPGSTSPPTRPWLLEARASVSSARRHHPHINHRLSNWPLAYLPSFGAMLFTIPNAPVEALSSLE